MSQSYEMHVISNTHWDREWVYNFQETRMQLVEFFDRLLDILDNEPGYRSYLLDSQAVPVEDYLEVRPEQRDRIARHVAGGRLLIGPWYTCPEEFCVGGESLVRNLLYGHRIAREFGGVMKVGHTPFSYGQNSQMPQIYAGFGIDTILFYHGVSHDDTPNEFIFEGADGTRILASQMSAKARYNFYFGLYRPVLYGTSIDERSYHWPQGGLPFHLCCERHCMDHHFLLDVPRHFYKKNIAKCFEAMLEQEKNTATTRYLAFMDGHDSSIADAATLRIIEEAKQYVGKNMLFHSSLPALMEKVKGAVKDLVVLKGERRVPKLMDGRIHLYSDVLSSRAHIKRLNARAETTLQRWAEPFAAVAWSLGGQYPKGLLDLAWKMLLKCHAHDSIAGSGVDDIEQDMVYRLRQVVHIGEGVARRGLENIQRRIDNAAGKDDVLFTVFNASPRPRSEVVTVVADLPKTSGYGPGLSLAESGRKTAIPVQVLCRGPHHVVVTHPGDSKAMMACDRVRFHFLAENVPGLGYATYRLQRETAKTGPPIGCGHNLMQNEHVRVRINGDGTLCVTHKATGRTFDGLHYFEDSGEAGHAWMHSESAFDRIITSHSEPATVTLEENGPLLARYRIVYRLDVPVGMDENGGDPWQRLDGGDRAARRTEETQELVIISEVTLKKGARRMDVVTRFENRCKNHRLRVMFPTHLNARTCHAESAFDVVEREIEHGPGHPWAKAIQPTFPMQRFIDVHDGEAGLAVLNEGLREYQVSPDAERTVALTLLRAYELSLTTVSKCWDRHSEMGLSQSPGEHECRYAIYPHAGGWVDADVPGEAEAFLLPLQPAQVGPHGGDLPARHGFLNVEPAALALSALKQSEDGQAWLVRVFNPTETAVEGKLTFDRKVLAAELVTLDEENAGPAPTRGKSVVVSAGPKKILTVKAILA